MRALRPDPTGRMPEDRAGPGLPEERLQRPISSLPDVLSDSTRVQDELRLPGTLLKAPLQPEAGPRDKHFTGHHNQNQRSGNETPVTQVAKGRVRAQPGGSLYTTRGSVPLQDHVPSQSTPPLQAPGEVQEEGPLRVRVGHEGRAAFGPARVQGWEGTGGGTGVRRTDQGTGQASRCAIPTVKGRRARRTQCRAPAVWVWTHASGQYTDQHGVFLTPQRAPPGAQGSLKTPGLGTTGLQTDGPRSTP